MPNPIINRRLFGSVAPSFIVASGGSMTEDGDYNYHVFTSSGNLVVSSVGNQDPTVEYLVVAGGGGGGGFGGGGAGGYRTASGFSISAGTYPIVVGAGGAVSGSILTQGSDGSDSSFSTITSVGGGGGGCIDNTNGNGRDGGSGGGGGNFFSAPYNAKPGGLGTVGQGNNGGDGLSNAAADGNGGGGGSGSVGQTQPANATGGAGGSGTSNSITGVAVVYAAGGGGSGFTTKGLGGSSSVGGDGAQYTGSVAATTPSANTGSGGGSAYAPIAGSSGADGIVIIRYRAR